VLQTRVIPTLLIKKGGLVITRQFGKSTYVGDPINAIKIFNDKDVDEIMVLDISATEEGRGPNFAMIQELAEECFMPLAYGGGISAIEEIRQILSSGVEKVALNWAAISQPGLIQAAANEFGSQAIMVSIDAKRNLLGRYKVMAKRGRQRTGRCVVEAAIEAERMGAGEILLNAVDKDGMMAGVDRQLIASVAEELSVPLIAMGGVGHVRDLAEAKAAGASAVAGGAFFVFQGPHHAVLISYPDRKQLAEVLA
jgi:imidazole glycerol-phosphate synthase subunit HisF